MSRLRVISWNVLHRVHAENYREPLLDRWPDERARIASIAAWIEQCGADVICLQEVSGDQLAALRCKVHTFAYPRVPSFRKESASLADLREHLAIIVRDRDARIIGAEAFTSDRGKGFLAVELGECVAVTTHVTYGDRMPAQLERLGAFVSAFPRVVVCGDFNAERAACAPWLGVGFSGAELASSGLHTRPRQQPAEKSQDIDHVFARGVTITGARVEDGAERSDHNPVFAAIEG